MYRLQIFRRNEQIPHKTVRAARAPDVLEQIAMLLQEHPECDRIEVSAIGVRLFAVDREGKRIKV